MLHHLCQRHARWFGVLGSTTIILGAALAATGYAQTGGHGYSFLNRAISDLGDPQGSRWSVFFNGGMVLGSAMLALFTYGIGSRLQTRRSPRITRIGVYGAIGMGFVGLFPSTPGTQHLHLLVAGIAFACTIALGASFTYDMLRTEQDVLPRWLVIPGAIAAACSASFVTSMLLTATHVVPREALRFGQAGPRPYLDLVPLLEWSVLFSILIWSLLTAAAARPIAAPRPLD